MSLRLLAMDAAIRRGCQVSFTRLTVEH